MTAPADRVPFLHKVVYGIGGFVNNTLAAASGGMLIVLNLGLGMNPALVGLLGSLPRLTDALTDPVMGHVSDRTRSRWGRRRPYLFVGAVAVGLVYMALWHFPDGRSESFYYWWFLVGLIVFFMAYTVFATPWVALGYELTPDFHERTRLMGVQNWIAQFAYFISPWYLAFMSSERLFDSQVEGARWLAVMVGVAAIGLGILPAILLRERVRPASAESHSKEPASRAVATFLRGVWRTVRVRPFLLLCLATFLVFNGFQLIASFQTYVLIYYVSGGDQELGAYWAGLSGTVGFVATIALVIPLVTWVSTRVGKRRAFFLSTWVAVAGYAMKWFCLTPAVPWLSLVPAPFMAFAFGGLFTLMPSMVADVVDLDELETGERREGLFGSIFWWVVKLGLSLALAGSGFLLNWTGFDVALAGAQTESALTAMRALDAFVPALVSAVAIWAVHRYPITEESATEVRRTLEARRGRMELAAQR